MSAREREEAGYRFGEGCCWAVGRLRSWAETFPRVHFHVFISSLLFLFLISDFFYIFCKNASNQIKQIPSAFKYSLQCFEPLINMFSK
jgi:hypothetical protein